MNTYKVYAITPCGTRIDLGYVMADSPLSALDTALTRYTATHIGVEYVNNTTEVLGALIDETLERLAANCGDITLVGVVPC